MIIGNFIRIGNNSSVGVTPEYQALIAYADANGITKPSSQELSAYSTFLNGLDAAGLLSRMKTGNIYGFGSIEFGTLNIKNPNTFRHIVVGTTPTFTQGQGVKSAGAGSCLNTQFAANEYAGIESDLTTIIDINEGGSTSATERVYGAVITGNTAQRIQLNTASRFMYVGAATNFTNADSRGTYIMTYDGVNSVLYKDRGKFSSATTPIAPTNASKTLLLAFNTSTTLGGAVTVGGSFTRNVMCLFRFDRFSDADASAFYTLWEAFKQSVAYSTSVFYVRPAGTTYGTGSGTSYENAWAGFSSIVNTSLLPGSTLYICGTHLETLTVGANGVTYRGDYPGDAGVIDGENTRNRCIYNEGYSYNTFRSLTITDATTDCLGIYNNSQSINVISVTATSSGNQAYQNEGTSSGLVRGPSVTYTNSSGSGCGDDGMSLHGVAYVIANSCTFENNVEGANGINTGILICNDCVFINNSTDNVKPDGSCDFTMNNCSFTDGLVVGNSTVPLKLNNCTFNNAATSGNVTITP
jgi:hypothetical protein